MSKVMIVDIEHTGFTNAVPIQVAARELMYEPNLIGTNPFIARDTFCQSFKPEVPIEHGATAVHHIFIEDLVNEPTALTSPTYLTLLAELNSCDYIIGHNVDTDIAALGLENVKPIDTLYMARKLLDTDSYSQAAVLLYFYGYEAAEEIKTAHDALADVNMCYKIFRMLLAFFARHQEKTVQEVFPTWESIYSFSEWCKVPDKMTFGKHKGKTYLEVAKEDPGYFTWMLTKSDISPDKYTVEAIKQAREQLKGVIK